MSAFAWSAYTATGRRRTGVLAADSEAAVRDHLATQGLFPEEISPVAERDRGSWIEAVRPRRSVGREDLALFTRQMAVVLQAELPVDEAIEAVLASEPGPAMRRLAVGVQARVRDGGALADAMRAADPGLPGFLTAAVAAGERSGELAQVFEVLAGYLEADMGERNRLASALAYPAFVAAVSLLVAGLLVTQVAPDLTAMLNAAGRPLPPLTAATLAVGDFAERWGLTALGVLLAGLVAFRRALHRPGFRDRWERLVLAIPVIGRLRRLREAAQYLRTFALALASRLPAIEAARCAEEVLGVLSLRAEARQAHVQLETGGTVARSLRGISALPVVAVRLIDSGEQSGRLAQMTERAARLVETRHALETRRAGALLEPVLMLVVGVVVLIIVLSILLPIFEIQSAIDA
jgi:general secretion pathway protein F